MTIRNILVPICPNIGFDVQLDTALGFARRIEAHVNAVYLRPDAITTIASIPEFAIAAGVTVERIEREERAAETAARTKFEAWREKHALSSGIVDQSLRTTYACWSERVGSIETNMVSCGRLSDLIVLNYPDPYSIDTERAFDVAAFDTGRPTVLVRDNVPDNPLRHVMIAWNGSLEATRALAGAMTLLHQAQRVSVFTAGRGAEESFGEGSLEEALTWHGIKAYRLTPCSEGGSVGAALLSAASDHGATLLVMGAYTHSRVRQMFLGGVTSHVLRHGRIPCLMTH